MLTQPQADLLSVQVFYLPLLDAQPPCRRQEHESGECGQGHNQAAIGPEHLAEGALALQPFSEQIENVEPLLNNLAMTQTARMLTLGKYQS